MMASSTFLPARSLIVYFSFTGNTETVARLLQKHTGATLMALERPADYLLGLDDDVDGPEPLEPDQVNLSDYDLVFLGFPIWTNQLPAATLAGLRIKGRPGQAFNTLRTLCPDARLLPPLALLGGVEEDGVLYPLEDEQLAEAERQLQVWADTVTASAGTPG